MNNTYPYWLTERMLHGIRRFNIDAYLVALEGWRRGLSLTFYEHNTTETDLKLIGFDPIGKLFSLETEIKKHFFYRTRGDKITKEAVDIGTDKEAAKNYLSEAGVDVPQGFSFTSETPLEEVREKLSRLKGPLVLKPTFGSLGKGVTTNIKSEGNFFSSLEYIQSTYDYTDFLVEEYITGEDVRVYVVGDEVAAATKRIPANVTGDGSSTIRQLIEEKNEKRKLNPHTSTRLIKADDRAKEYLSRQGFDLESVLDEGQTVFLKGESNISAGGDSIDITETLSESVKKVAVEAVEAIPDLHHAGVDLIVNEDRGAVIEINSTGSTALHTFPLYGEPQNVAEKIINYYFPETRNVTTSDQLFFDYKNILKQLRANQLKKIEITDAPVGEFYAKKYIISGKGQNIHYRIWIENQAIAYGLHGYARNIKNDKVAVVIGGIDKEAIQMFEETCYENAKVLDIDYVKKCDWHKEINIGFQI
ncbi:ATP-grasp domain-containing protein [Salinicoccus kekensis]|uniref:acylphosphatase n=1 Tax=Salinicoccus kekensis TaxID=714307 RepID=A0A285UHF8_9STAP|nr:ATP-grasp domain-containing protein [Salinicoccus kekensis]SOC41203.1 D-alanine-D-alanine ligase-like ATP-grasp enzyme [Salinicoccus kekensis]